MIARPIFVFKVIHELLGPIELPVNKLSVDRESGDERKNRTENESYVAFYYISFSFRFLFQASEKTPGAGLIPPSLVRSIFKQDKGSKISATTGRQRSS